jgi:BirA family biotin operon repressor/biotin-[acetyl-CoA-carboxylase] ligase
MDQSSLESTLADLNLPAIRFFPSIGSTNDEALRWIATGASDRALVIADEQTAGRGRFHHHWVTPSGAGLAFSLVLLSPPLDPKLFSRLTGLGALAVLTALKQKYLLPVLIKWPNDVLIDHRKVAGVLVEAQWSGENLSAVVIGIGINIAPESVSEVHLPSTGLNFPVTCVESALGHTINRLELLHTILQELLSWLLRLSLPDFIDEWEANLAFRHQWVELSFGNSGGDKQPFFQAGGTSANTEVGKLVGLTSDGTLKLLTRSGKLVTASVGEIHLRPVPSRHSSLPRD